MPFPFTIKFSRNLSQRIKLEDRDKVLRLIVQRLRDKSAVDIKEKENSVTFNSPGIQFSWELFAPIDGGKFLLNGDNNGFNLIYSFSMYLILSFFLILMIVGFFITQSFISIILIGIIAIINWLIPFVRHKEMFNNLIDQIDMEVGSKSKSEESNTSNFSEDFPLTRL